MRVWNKIKRFFNLGVTDPKAWDQSLWNLYGAQSKSGEVVNEYTALTYSAFYNAVALISGTIGSLPLHLKRKTGNKNVYETNHPLYRVLHSVANPYMTAMSVRECLMSHILTWGNGYAEIVRDGVLNVKELWPITPNRIKPKMVDGELVYEITVGSEVVVLPRRKVLHIPGLGFDGFVGYSVVSMARKSIGLGMAMETFGELFFGQGTHPGVVVSHPGQLGEEAHKNLTNSLKVAHEGLGKSHRLLLLEEGMKLEKLGIPPNDSQFLESRQFQIPEMARWFNLPPHKLKDLTKSSFNNIESENSSFVIDTCLPWAVRIEQNYNMQLLRPTEVSAGLYFKHIFEGLLRGNSKDRAEFYSKMFNIGAMSINEIREKEDLNPVDGGDIHLVPLNMTTLENAGKNPIKDPPTPPKENDDDNEALDGDASPAEQS